MDLLPDEAQQEIVDAASSFLDAEMPLSRFRTGAAGALPDAEQWSKLAGLGWIGLGLSEEDGGVGLTLAEEALLFREIGRRLGPIALLATALAARIAARDGKGTLRDDLIAGRVRAAWTEPAGRSRGTVLVFDGEEAGVLVVAGGEGAGLFERPPASGRARPCLDETVGLADASLDGAPRLAEVGADERIAERAAALAAAMLCGVAEEARDQATRYATGRVQFGKPIGVFQAVKHRCADMAVRCEAAWSQTAYAGLALRDGHADAGLQVAAAKIVATDAALANAAGNVQVHGGYGFTTEFDAHLLVKRAHVLDRVAGAVPIHLRAMLDETGGR